MFKKIKNMSTLWIFVIIIGATLVTLGNFQYIKARERENKEEMAKQALDIILPELKSNKNKLEKNIKLMKEGKYQLSPPFETEAWNTITKSNLLIGLNTEELSNLIELYYSLNQSNNLHDQIVDTMTGLTGTLLGIDQIREPIINDYKTSMEESQKLLESTLKKQK